MNRATKALLCMTLASALAASGCVSAKKAPEAEQVFNYTDWGSFNTVLKSGNVLFGAGTDTHPGGKGSYTLQAVMFANSCAPQILSVTYDLDAPSHKAFKSQLAIGELRVDDMAPIKASYIYEFIRGKTKVFIDFNEAFNNEVLIDQLFKGHFIQVKVEVEGKELSFKFSLKNHVNAVKQAMNQCKEEAAFKGTGGAPAPVPAPKPAPSGSGPMPSTSPGKSDDSSFF